MQKAKELDNRRQGDRSQCPICNPRKDRVRMDQVWAWSQQNPGVSPWNR